MSSDRSLGIAMLVVFLVVCFTTATVSTVRRNRRSGRSFSRDDPINIWSSTGQDGQHHNRGQHGGGSSHHG